jgi:hypothetical protein
LTTLTGSRWKVLKILKNEHDGFIRSVREVLLPYGRDYALGAVRGLAVRNMISVDLPETSDGFYPIVKIHEMALKDLEEVFYSQVQMEEMEVMREALVLKMVHHKVWE